MMKATTIITTALLAIGNCNALSTPSPPVPTLIPGEVNAKLSYAKSSFPIVADDLLNRAKEVLSPQIEIGTKDDGKCLADDFEFVAAVLDLLESKNIWMH